jgi:hypothetical protein
VYVDLFDDDPDAVNDRLEEIARTAHSVWRPADSADLLPGDADDHVVGDSAGDPALTGSLAQQGRGVGARTGLGGAEPATPARISFQYSSSIPRRSLRPRRANSMPFH